MKQYLIYMKSGAVIEGEAEDEQAKLILEMFDQLSKDQNAFYSIKDRDGEVLLRFCNVDAVIINNLERENDIGFRGN